MHIDENTKISKIIRSNPESIDAIASISQHFEKLKIPFLRKALASRVTIKQAAKIGGVTVNKFYEKLEPLGYTFNKPEQEQLTKNIKMTKEIKLKADQIVDLDVRPILRENKDPFNIIMETIDKLPNGTALKIINTFEPVPLINLLTKKGFISETEIIDKQLYHTFFLRRKDDSSNISPSKETADLLEKYKSKIVEIDVRKLEMPLPMSTILNELNTLPEGFTLYVHHKKVPQFLLPELAERGYKWHIDEISASEINILIYK